MRRCIGSGIRHIVILISIVFAGEFAQAETLVYLLGGQSNMAGVGGWSTDKPLPSPYDVPQNEVKFWDNNGWVPLRGGFGYTSSLFGPEVSFGYTLHNTIFPQDDIYLVKLGVSATSLAVDWNPNGTGPIYNAFKSKVDAALQDLRDANLSPKIAGMLWMQGESDALNSAYAVNYQTNLTNLVECVRSDFNAPDMKFVVGRITTLWGTPADNSLVRNAQETVPDLVGNASWINTDDLQWAYSGHYGTQGQIDLGIRFAYEVPEPSATTQLAICLTAAGGCAWRTSRGKALGRRFTIRLNRR